MLYDKEFLLKLDSYPHRTTYARVTALTFQENPIEYIEGRVTQGSINVDGSSAVRRTCSLTIAAPNFNYNDYYWGLNTKFKLEIGLENHVDSNYPDIIWFKQGIFLLTSFNTSRGTTNFNISLQGKDKMCLLNGDVGGSLESSVDFGTIQQEDVNGNWVVTKVPIEEIIRNMVHTYAGEPYHNIIINDLDTYGLELMEYRYDVPMFLYRPINSSLYKNIILEGKDIFCKVYNKENTQEEIPIILFERDKDGSVKKDDDGYPIKKPPQSIVRLNELPIEYFESLTDRLIQGNNEVYVIETAFKISDFPDYDNPDRKFYYFAKVEYGQTAGYRFTDLVYAGDLIASVGESLTSVLDKIKNMLVEFEYFYNLEGQFVFQKKRSLKEAIWQFNKNDKLYIPPEYSYEFYGSNLITAFNNNPNLLNLRNDYSIWGERDSISGAKIPIHLRYAIDKKPTKYNSITIDASVEYDLDFDGQPKVDKDGNKIIISKGIDYDAVERYNKKYNTAIGSQSSVQYLAGNDAWDWRELIYQMALDYYKYNFLDDFEVKVAAANPDIFPLGKTGYEQYYIDIQGFWRELYNPDVLTKRDELKMKIDNLEKEVSNGVKVGIIPNIKGQIKTLTQQIYNYDIEDISHTLEEWRNRQTWATELKNAKEELIKMEEQLEDFQKEYENLKELVDQYYLEEDGVLKYWNKAVYQQPDQLNFWFDFLDTDGELQQFNVKTVGSRSKVINDTNIKSIYFRETPSVIYQEYGEEELDNAETGYKYIQIPTSYDNMFSLSAQGLGAKDKLDELLYQHGYCIESVTINTIPIYHLEPNTRIYLHDDTVGLDGDYIVSKVTVPMIHNGTMQITATKAAENNIV